MLTYSRKDAFDRAVGNNSVCKSCAHMDRKFTLETLEKMKNLDKNLKISQWFLDPLSKYGPDHANNSKRILDKIGNVLLFSITPWQ